MQCDIAKDRAILLLASSLAPLPPPPPPPSPSTSALPSPGVFGSLLSLGTKTSSSAITSSPAVSGLSSPTSDDPVSPG